MAYVDKFYNKLSDFLANNEERVTNDLKNVKLPWNIDILSGKKSSAKIIISHFELYVF